LRSARAGDVGDLEEREQRGMMLERRVERGEMAHPREQILEAHESAHALVEGMLVADQSALTGRHCRGNATPVQARAREIGIEGVQARDLRRERVTRAAVVDHVVGLREARVARQLRCHDGAHFLLARAAAQRRRASPARPPGSRRPARGPRASGPAALEQQRDDEQAVRPAPCGDLLVDPRAHERVQDRLEPLARLRVGERRSRAAATARSRIAVACIRARRTLD
jgi:hypothetical protein